MRCQSLDNLLQQLDPHLLPLTFVFPSQDSLLMQRKLSPTYLCEIGRCAKLPCLWGDVLLLDINVMLGGLRRCWYVIVWWLTEWSALWACCLTHCHSYLYQYHSLITVLPLQLSQSMFYSKWWPHTEIDACFTSDLRTWWHIYCMNGQLGNRKNCPFKLFTFHKCIKEAKLILQCMIFGLLLSCLILWYSLN